MAVSSIYMRLYWGDLMRDVGHLTAEEMGAYLFVMGHLWVSGGRATEDRLKRVSRLQSGSTSWAAVREFLTENDDGTLSQKRLTVELAASQSRIDSASAAGLASVAARSQRPFNARSTPVQRPLTNRTNGSSTVPVPVPVPVHDPGPDPVPGPVPGQRSRDPEEDQKPTPERGQSPAPPYTECVTAELVPDAKLNRKPVAGRSGPSVFDQVTTSFSEAWERSRGVPYLVTPADKSQLGKLLQGMAPANVLRLPEIFARYCADPDDFVAGQGHSLKYFCTSGGVNKYGASVPVSMGKQTAKAVSGANAWLEMRKASRNEQ